MLEYAQRIAHGGLPAGAVVLEEASTSTRTNALLSIPIMVERGCALQVYMMPCVAWNMQAIVSSCTKRPVMLHVMLHDLYQCVGSTLSSVIG